MGRNCHGYKVSFGGDESVLKLNRGAWLHGIVSTKLHEIVHFKMVNFL